MLRYLKRFLRSPRLIVGEITAIALCGVLGAALPQAGVASAAELERFRDGGPLWTALVNAFALDHIFRSFGFAAITVLASGSLVIVVLEQLRHLRYQWSLRLAAAHFHSAPFRVEFDRPVAGGLPSGLSTAPRERTWTEHRFGLLGSPLFHLGLLLVIVAGCWRALFGAEAGVDLLEGQTLAPTPQAWAAHWPGALARPFCLEAPLTLSSVRATRYESGGLRDLKVRLAIKRPEGVRETGIAVNHDSSEAGGRVFLTSDFGPAALLEWQRINAAPAQEAVLLKSQGMGNFESACSGPNGERAYLRAQVDAAGNPPQTVEVRIMKDGALLAVADAQAGQTLSLPDGTKLVLRGTPFWARLRGSRDSALWLAYAGFALILAGVTLIFTVVKVDGCVVVTPIGDREHVLVALKPRRFAPLFEERFQRLVQEQRGTPSSGSSEHCPAHESVLAGRVTPCARSGRLRTVWAWLRRARSDAPYQPVGSASRLACWLFLLLCAPLLTSCKPSASQQAQALVKRYNQVVSEAYRRGDVRLIDPVVGPREGKKLTGLIGVRLDFGITLDSHLLSLEVTGVERAKDVMRVSTKERWRYRDLRIGSGQQVGEESLDSYEMLYIFTNINKAWLVDEIRFTKPPWVGRSQTAWLADRKAAPAGANPAQPEHPHP
jgi:hypothetical protein